MKNRFLLVLAIYSIAGLLALDLHASDDDEIIGPPTAEEQQPKDEEQKPAAPAPKVTPKKPTQKKPVTPKPQPRQEEPGDHPEEDRDADGNEVEQDDCEECELQRPNRPNRPNQSQRPSRPNRPNRPNNTPNYPMGPNVQWIKIVCPQARVEFFGLGDSASHCYVEGTRKRYQVILDSTGIEFGVGSFFLEIKHTPGSDIAGYYTGDGASIGIPLPLPVGGAGGKFYQIPKRRGTKPLNRATLVGAQFGLGFSMIDGIRIRRARR